MDYIDHLYDKNFLEYASYVIKDRAIPHIDDGLKPVQRRIMHSLFELDDGKFHKVANTVGFCMKYHPHGDASIYSALVVIANKDMLIDKQGNFGNIYTGDPASAARYIECRCTALAKEALYNPKITEYMESYDGRNKEPVVFPSKLPILLAHGTEGIAVGMSTKILPHNLIELLKAQISCLKKRSFKLYPDFQTGGSIDVSEYEDGNGKVLVRASLDISDPKKIIVRQLPFGTTTESLIESIEAAGKKNKIKISGIQDFTAEKVEIEIRLMRGVQAEDVVDALYAFTDCELSISTNLMVIHENHPQSLTVTQVLKHNTEKLVEILTAELKHEQKELEDKLHAKTLEQIFIENRIYKKIEQMKTADGVMKAVHEGLVPYKKQIKREVTDDDVTTLLRIPIRRISLYDINKANDEIKNIKNRLKEIKHHLNNITQYAIDYLKALIEQHKKDYPRKTKITSLEKVDVREAARKDLKLRYDKKTGYLGTEANGEVLMEVSQYDRLLCIKKNGDYQVVNTPDKLFVDKGMLYCGFIEPDLNFNIIYKNKKNQCAYIKRCNIEKYILNKNYSLIPEGCSVLAFKTGDKSDIFIEYKPKPKLKIKKETFSLADYPLRSNKAGGMKLSSREAAKASFVAVKGSLTKK